jgi:adenine-specific DNA-methyltransferase
MPTLSWLGDHEARTAARRVDYRILQPVESYGDPNSENLLIKGDNLQALKALLPFYAGRVKCIFIDPPYNTKSAFEHYDDNLEHSQWLSMMYPRLELLRELLSVDGSIWMAIDDSELHYLKALCDEVFGRLNFAATIVWEKADSPRNSARQFSTDQDYILVYSRKTEWAPNRLPRNDASNSIYRNPDSDPRGPWLPGDPYANKPYSRGLYTFIGPTGRSFKPPPGRFWRTSEEKLSELDADGRIWWGPKKDARPSIKKYLSEVSDLVPRTLWSHGDVGSNRTSKNEMRALFPGDASFDTPKPEALIERILLMATAAGDLVLDSYLGSGTTAAVAHKMGRRWIGIEMGEHASTHCLPRLTKVVDGEQGGVSEAVGWKGGGGFRFMKLGAKAFFDDGALNADIRFKDLAAYLWFLNLRTPHSTNVFKSPLLGMHEGTAYVLLYNGILADRRPESGNVLTNLIWADIKKLLPKDRRETVIYGEACRLSVTRLRSLGITFKQIPYDVGMR